jgi:phosphoglycerol transferase MdoB-like AlkP superfamily enzyme
MKTFKGRYSLLVHFSAFYIILSTIVRIALFFLVSDKFSTSFWDILETFAIGFVFDFAVSLCFVSFYSVYLLLMPSKFVGKKLDKIITFFIFFLMLFIAFFAFMAEFPFWDEFKTRFNFIAVDYLIYTYEVVENINQSYPIPLILIVLFAVIFLVFYVFSKKGIFRNTFQDKLKFRFRLIKSGFIWVLTFVMMFFMQNKMGEHSENTYINEISKNGIFSFFNALKSNELNYEQFYTTIPENEAYSILKKELLQDGDFYTNNKFDNITRKISGESTETPNIILVCIESFSAGFLKKFDNEQNLTPNYEKFSENGIFFTNMFSTGTRTVRGMEALTLCVPPTPGNSIVRRPDNDALFSIATILKKKNYSLEFIYGGDGYFDNMNAFFGGQGFTIVDRNRGNPIPENIKTERINIENKDVTFENAWGICDEDIYNQSIRMADLKFKNDKPFFQFIMTTSNHKPYTFPENRISMPQGNRESAVKYTDFALGKFIDEAKTKSWFENTVFVIVADHCASSAGKWEINTEKHHIPAVIYNLKNVKSQEIGKLSSQIDLMPTLFSLLNWNYENSTFGKNILKMKPEEERALIGNYRTLGLLKQNIFTQINDRKMVQQFGFEPKNKTISGEIKNTNNSLKNLTISYYQTASERFKNGKMKEKGD